jgi:SAM-dependent MidA family methyltransferase
MQRLELPEPNSEEKQHSAQLLTLIRQAVEQAGGWLDFADYMRLALYAPGLGYYSAGLQKFGGQGDFITAPELSPLFAQTLAVPVAQSLARLPQGNIIEFGAGSGKLAAQMLLRLEQLEHVPEQYFIVELSAELRQRQAQTLQQLAPGLADRIHWLETLPEHIDAVVIANEVLDAMPVRRFSIKDGALQMLGVTNAESGLQLQSRFADADMQKMIEHLQQDIGRPFDEAYSSEFNPSIQPWLAALDEALDRAAVYLIDYGYPRAEYYLPERVTGTFMGYYRQRAFDDALWYPGLQDMTAFVDFTAVAEAAVQHGFELAGFTSQGNFLMDCGITELLDANRDEQMHLLQVQQLKTLTQNAEMGERFKVMALGRGTELPDTGFRLRDYSYRL